MLPPTLLQVQQLIKGGRTRTGMEVRELIHAERDHTDLRVRELIQSERGQPDGVAALGPDGTVPADQLPALEAHTHPVGDITNLQTMLNAKEDVADKGQSNGYAGLDETGVVPLLQLPDLGGGGPHTHPISDVTGLQTALDDKLDDSQVGSANGVASLDADGLVPLTQLPPAGGGAPEGDYAAGTFTVATGRYKLMAKELALTGSQRATLEGTSRLVIA